MFPRSVRRAALSPDGGRSASSGGAVASALRDAFYPPPARPGAFDRWARALINDPRDVPFVHLALSASLCVFPVAAWLFYQRRFPWWVGAIYLAALFLTFVDRVVLMLHNTSHRPLFRSKYRALNHYIPWVLGPFLGQAPEAYFTHHIGMHHPENNLEADLSSTMGFQRDNPWHFLRYLFRFLFVGIADLGRYLESRKRGALRRRLWRGELSFWALCALLCLYSWPATLVVFIAPVVIVRVLMMCGNWGQHALIDPRAPENCYRNSITCIDSRYNRRCFNDGYHIGHHVKASMHWTDMPGEFVRNRNIYATERAIVFHQIDFFLVWAMLMTKQFPALARCYVHLGDGPRPSDAEIIAMIRERLPPIVRAG